MTPDARAAWIEALISELVLANGWKEVGAIAAVWAEKLARLTAHRAQGSSTMPPLPWQEALDAMREIRALAAREPAKEDGDVKA